jgi:hypothetical protein
MEQEQWLRLLKKRPGIGDYIVEDLSPETIEFMRKCANSPLKQVRSEHWCRLQKILREWVAAADIPFNRSVE